VRSEVEASAERRQPAKASPSARVAHLVVEASAA
jgi:hypothetical protein